MKLQHVPAALPGTNDRFQLWVSEYVHADTTEAVTDSLICAEWPEYTPNIASNTSRPDTTASLQPCKSEKILVDTTEAVTDFLDCIGWDGLPNEPPSLYLDLEGNNLGRKGTLSLLQMKVLPTNQIFVIDVYVLEEHAFTTRGKDGKTLRHILESAATTKVLFDVRNDSDALFNHYHIKLAGVIDLQLMELAYRHGENKRYLKGLASCISECDNITAEDKTRCLQIKAAGKVWAKQDDFSIFDRRPLDKAAWEYSVGDVDLLPLLYHQYARCLSSLWWDLIMKESVARVAESQTCDYQPDGVFKGCSPHSFGILYCGMHYG